MKSSNFKSFVNKYEDVVFVIFVFHFPDLISNHFSNSILGCLTYFTPGLSRDVYKMPSRLSFVLSLNNFEHSRGNGSADTGTTCKL